MRKKNRKHCVELAKKIAKQRDGYRCLWCGRDENSVQIQGSHIKGEGAYPNLSYLPRNIKALCAECHRRWHSAPTDSAQWFKEKYPDWYEEIQALAREPVGKPDYDAIYTDLKKQYENH